MKTLRFADVVLKLMIQKSSHLLLLGAFTAIVSGCSVATKFASDVSASCTPASTSARFGQNPGPVILSPTADTPFNTNMPVSGTCATGVPVVISGVGLAATVTTACTAGTFATTVQLTGADGQKQLQASQVSAASGADIADALCVDRLTVPPAVTINHVPGNNGSQAISTTTNVVTGTCENGLTVVITSPDLANPISVSCSSSTFTATLTLTGPDGPKPITATQVDQAGNTGNASATYLIDTTPPKITIAAPTANTLTNHALNITGTCETGLSVVIEGTGEAGVQSVPCTNGTYSTPLVYSAGDGIKNLIASQTDLAGNNGQATTSVLLDTTAPLITISSPAANAFVGVSGTITGTCETGLNVSLGGTGITASQVVGCIAATYSANVTYSANDGSKIVTATQTDGAGNIGSATKTYTKDTINPVVTINTPALNAYVPASVAITGNCLSGFNVNLSGAGIVTPVVAACANSAYTGTVTFSAGDGNKVVTATETDAGGLSGSASRTFIRDTTAPTLTITAPTANTYVGANTVLVTGTCSETGTVVVSGSGVVAPVNASCNGSTFSTTITFTTGDGSKQITASETDPANNTGSTNVTVIKDTTAPKVAITFPAANAFVAATSAISGTCETGLSVSVSGSGIMTPQMATCAAGVFSTNVTFTNGDGSKLVTASQTDLAGNVGTDSKTYLKDTTVPVVSITSPAANSYVAASVAIVGGCETGYNVVVAGTGVIAPVTSICNANSYSATVTFTAGDGAKAVTATETDNAGLTGTTSSSFIRDTTAPVVTITAPAANAYVSNSAPVTGACETGLTVTVAGSGVAAAVTTTCASNAYSATVTFTNGDGSKTITASETDAAGNTGSATVTVKKDTTLPVVTITSPAALTYVAATAAISGTCEAGFNVTVAGTGVVTPQTSACPTGTFSATVTFTAGDGSKAVTASETDAAGLTGSTSQTYVRDTTSPVVTIVTPANNAYVSATPTVQGTCENGANVIVSGTGVTTPQTVACSNGAFSTPVTLTANDGSKQVVASETDAAGNTGSATVTVNKDTTLPVVTITSPANNTYVAATANVMGTCESGYNVVVAGSGITGSVTVACVGSAFTSSVTFTAGDGGKVVTATETDLGGLSGSDSKTYLRDTTAPVVAITSPAANTAVNGNITISGTCEASLNVVLAGTGATTSVTTMCTAMGTFTGTVTLLAPDGTKNITATQTDLAGNTGSDNRNFILLSTAPTVAITAPAANTSAQTGLTITGTCETGVNVVLAGTGASPSINVPCTTGAFSGAITFSSGDGTKNITATQTDAAGNMGSDNRNFIKDTTAPVVTIATPAANTSAQMGLTVGGACETGLNVTLAGSGAAASVTVMCSAGAYSSAITFTSGDGSKIITASQTDAAGNTGSATRTFIKDTTAPFVAITSPAANTATHSTITVGGTCETGLNVTLAGTGASAPVTATCGSGNFSATVTLVAPDGTKNITASQTDLAGNTGTDSRNFVLLTTAPAIAITAPAAGTVAQTGLTVSGTCQSGLNVVLAGSGAQSSVTTACTSGVFSSAIVFSTGDGVKNITASQTDAAGNVGSDNRNFSKDTTAPLIAITSPAANTATRTTITVAGTCETGLNVTLAGAGVTTPVTAACASGAFTGVVTLLAPDGTKNITASQTDLAGNTGNDNRNFVLSTTAPTVAITAPAVNTSAQNGLTVSGTCVTAINVVLAGAGASAPVTVACNSSAFSGAILFTSGDGTKNITATQTDSVGNTGSDNRNFIKDTVAPLVAITAPAANSYVTTSVTISGTCETGLNVALAGTGATASVSTACNAGNFSASVTISAADGSKNITATQTDLAGNVGTDNRTFLKDTTAPAVAITSPAANTAAQNGLSVGGTCETGLNVTVAGTGVNAPVTAACNGGAFSAAIIFTTGDGTKNVTATQTDLAGNVGSDNRNFVKDSTAPAIAITAPAAGTVAQTGVTLTGTCQGGLTVNLSGSGLQSPATTTCAPAGSFSVAITFTSGDGNKNIIASQTDTAGNTGSDNRTFVKDSTAPIVKFTSPAANTVAQNTISVSGTCESGLNVVLAGSGVSASVTTACSASTFTAVVTFGSPDGNKIVTATQTDLAGNVGSDSRVFVRDTTAPAVAITSPAANTTAKSGVTLTGTCESGLTVVLGGSGLQSPTSTTCTSSAFSVAITFTTSDGSKAITASQTDGAGNTGSDSRTFIEDNTAPVVSITSPATGTTVPAAITLQGACETGLTVSITGSLTASASATCSGGAYSQAITLTAANGSKTVNASQTDAAGNTGTATATYTVAGNVGNDSFTSKGPGGVVDIIFSDDNSASMINDETTLANKFQNFASDLSGTNWQIGVVTTDCTAGSDYDFCGQLQPMVGASSGQYILTSTTPNFVNVFENTIIRPEASPNCITTNTCASGNSQLLQPVAKAFTLQNTTNAGFFRPNADLAVIAISNGHTGYAGLSGYVAPTTFVSDFNTAFSGTGKRLIGYGIIIQPNDSTCLTTEQSGTGGSTAAYAQDMYDLAAQTGGTTVSICAPDYSVTLANIASSVVNLGNSYTLAHTPISGTVSVTFTPAATSPYTISGNVITFSPPPAAGTAINITYQY